MAQMTTKDMFHGLVRDAQDAKTAAGLALSEQAAIAYYYDVLKARVAQLRTGGTLQRPDVAAVQEAARTVNRACANQKKKYLFDGKIDNPADLFRFAQGIAAPAAAM